MPCEVKTFFVLPSGSERFCCSEPLSAIDLGMGLMRGPVDSLLQQLLGERGAVAFRLRWHSSKLFRLFRSLLTLLACGFGPMNPAGSAVSGSFLIGPLWHLNHPRRT